MEVGMDITRNLLRRVNDGVDVWFDGLILTS